MYSVVIQEFKVFPSTVTGKQFDATWRVELDADSDEFIPKFRILIAERDIGPWFSPIDPIEESQIVGVASKTWTNSPSCFLKLCVLDPNNVTISESPAIAPAQGMLRKDFLNYRELLRQENLGLRKANGFKGIYIPRLMRGPKCKRCSDEILNGAPDSNCCCCFGTGITTGYLPGIEILADWSDVPQGKGNIDDTPFGPMEVEMKQIRTLPFPVARAKDIFVDCGTGARYVVNKIDQVIYKVWVQAQVLTLILLPKNDPAYKVPIPPREQ